eukprot:7073312-Prymnesium_polylepis.1
MQRRSGTSQIAKPRCRRLSSSSHDVDEHGAWSELSVHCHTSKQKHYNTTAQSKFSMVQAATSAALSYISVQGPVQLYPLYVYSPYVHMHRRESHRLAHALIGLKPYTAHIPITHQ